MDPASNASVYVEISEAACTYNGSFSSSHLGGHVGELHHGQVELLVLQLVLEWVPASAGHPGWVKDCKLGGPQSSTWKSIAIINCLCHAHTHTHTLAREATGQQPPSSWVLRQSWRPTGQLDGPGTNRRAYAGSKREREAARKRRLLTEVGWLCGTPSRQFEFQPGANYRHLIVLRHSPNKDDLVCAGYLRFCGKFLVCHLGKYHFSFKGKPPKLVAIWNLTLLTPHANLQNVYFWNFDKIKITKWEIILYYSFSLKMIICRYYLI